MSSDSVVTALARALDRVEDRNFARAGVINWGSPIPVFGDPSTCWLATVGINPSNREFLTASGEELRGAARRFHTLSSLGIANWSQTHAQHLAKMVEASARYFANNPYDGWFKRLDRLLSGIGVSFYGDLPTACHLDLVPFATSERWATLPASDRGFLLQSTTDIVANLVSESAVEVLILNGRTVVSYVEQLAGAEFRRRTIPAWALPRQSANPVDGVAFTGLITSLSGVRLDREIMVLGFNHNLQSSYGITREVLESIRRWLARNMSES